MVALSKPPWPYEKDTRGLSGFLNHCRTVFPTQSKLHFPHRVRDLTGSSLRKHGMNEHWSIRKLLHKANMIIFLDGLLHKALHVIVFPSNPSWKAPQAHRPHTLSVPSMFLFSAVNLTRSLAGSRPALPLLWVLVSLCLALASLKNSINVLILAPETAF